MSELYGYVSCIQIKEYMRNSAKVYIGAVDTAID
jgi:hypothetical protein